MIKRFRGDDKRIGFSLKDKITKAVIPLAGCTVTLSVSETENPETAEYIFQSQAIVTDEPNGVGYFPLTKEQVDFSGTKYYDIAITDANGEDFTFSKSQWFNWQDIGK